MAAIIISDDDLKDDNLEVPQETAAAPAPAPVAEAPKEDELPEKYRGKSPAELAKMHRELEQRLGAQGEELGSLRSTIDAYIKPTLDKARSGKADSPTESQDDDSAFFLKPKEAIAKAIEEHPLVKELRQSQSMSQQEKAANAFAKKHPDAQEVLADPEFRKWVEASKVRMGLMHAAHTKYDVDAGDELFSTYKEIRGVRAKPAAPAPDDSAAKAARADALRAGVVPSGNAAPISSGDSNKPFLSRRAIMKMMTERPDEYAARADEIFQAYAEKRVRN